ncbi:BOI-RELATED E3 UBIQUITIN-PROTEIN LIGASE 1-LIKE [Salix koriyanagi]|uniref:BOI-RELATED E3 UBIQUITIN-PROTEIN LIGASE 1-LIKE n=1 Tax=Salix koriyanagi TaxID=2511006 RepID=A0A9Q0PWY6_9ROSI|nr:BOI-RELATED E3 UBIQUITIN-PROTEIN LIGASE 1-LIKE [Salix koriyanagi]
MSCPPASVYLSVTNNNRIISTSSRILALVHASPLFCYRYHQKISPPKSNDNEMKLINSFKPRYQNSLLGRGRFFFPLKAVQKWMRRFHFMQGEQLRRTLAEKRQRHFRALLGAAEESIARKLREKEMEVEKATRRNAELEARATQLSIEAQVWQAKVRSQEVTAASLQAQLQQAIMNGGLAQDSRRGEDGIGCPGGVEGQTQAEDAESAYVDPDRVAVVPGGPSCKVCRKRMASVVLLPCRHLCVCTECDHVVQACPLCLHVRNSSVEVYLC